VREGRSIYDNVKKYLAFLLACNIGEILIMFLARLQGYLLPLLPIQILWVNLVTDGLPAIALGVDPPEPGVMDHPPRPKNQSIFTRGVLMNIGVVSLLMSVGALTMLNLYNPSRLDEGPIYVKSLTIVLTLVVMFEMFNAFNCRSDRKSILRVGPFKNRYLLAAVASSVVLQVLVVYVPQLQSVFDTSYLTLNDWLLILVLASSVILGVEVGKRILHRKFENPGSSLHSGYSNRTNPSVS
jgi:P-type Ca2+ transporter type 2C